ncbi:HemN family oxidoreductase [Pseudomonas aeruginosa]|nr:HemN family oxidoreductase [Pseudomonas aeruginosa]
MRKCPYCDFNSHAAGPELPEEAYVDALLADLEQDLRHVHGRRLGSIFFGGGTPSLFSAKALGRLLEGVERKVGFADGIEITLEANPGTFEQAKFADYRRLGINRPVHRRAELPGRQAAGPGAHPRRHRGSARRRHGAPGRLRQLQPRPDARPAGQSLDDALADLRQALALAPTHLSWYQLTMEPNTVFWSQPPELPEDDILWDIQEAGQALLDAHGYRQYETSAYARDGLRARHNLNYWSFGDFLGIGAGAHAKLSAPDGRIVADLEDPPAEGLPQPAKAFQAGERPLEAADLPFEFMMNVLRLVDGVPAALYPQRTGQRWRRSPMPAPPRATPGCSPTTRSACVPANAASCSSTTCCNISYRDDGCTPIRAGRQVNSADRHADSLQGTLDGLRAGPDRHPVALEPQPPVGHLPGHHGHPAGAVRPAINAWYSSASAASTSSSAPCCSC